MNSDKLFEVRCPGQILDKKLNKLVKCRKLCVKVYPGSSGEIQCRHCKLKFRFYVDSQAQSMLSVRAQPIDKEVKKDIEQK